MSKILETAIRDKIKLVDGKAFQQMFWDVAILRVEGLQTPRMQQDLGCDGYTVCGKTFFACYAPESLKYDNSDTASKIEDDYGSFCKNWKDKHAFEKWVFVTKDNLMGVPHQKLVDLNGNGDGIHKENWGIDHLVNQALCLEVGDAVRIFGLPDMYLVRAVNEEKDFGIIGEIFESIFVEKVPSSSVETIKNSDNYTELLVKLPLNFSDRELQTAKEMIVRNWEYKSLVEKYLEGESSRNPGRVDALVDLVQSDFRKIKSANYHGVAIECVKIIEDLALQYLPTDKQSNPNYVSGSRAIILYLFELCFLGKKTESEELKEVAVF